MGDLGSVYPTIHYQVAYNCGDSKLQGCDMLLKHPQEPTCTWYTDIHSDIHIKWYKQLFKNQNKTIRLQGRSPEWAKAVPLAPHSQHNATVYFLPLLLAILWTVSLLTWTHTFLQHSNIKLIKIKMKTKIKPKLHNTICHTLKLYSNKYTNVIINLCIKLHLDSTGQCE